MMLTQRVAPGRGSGHASPANRALGRNAAKNAPMTASTSASIAATVAEPGPLVTGESEAPIGYAGRPPCSPPARKPCQKRVFRHHSSGQ